MINAINLKDMDILRREGLKALADKLGPVGMINFIRLFDNGTGDYTKDRHETLENITEEDFELFLKKNK